MPRNLFEGQDTYSGARNLFEGENIEPKNPEPEKHNLPFFKK